MPVNEFEKQVQQKMEKLRLTPSPAVWSSVRKHILQEKRRRRLILWWTLPLLLSGGTAIFFLNRENRTDKTAAAYQKQMPEARNNAEQLQKTQLPAEAGTATTPAETMNPSIPPAINETNDLTTAGPGKPSGTKIRKTYYTPGISVRKENPEAGVVKSDPLPYELVSDAGTPLPADNPGKNNAANDDKVTAPEAAAPVSVISNEQSILKDQTAPVVAEKKITVNNENRNAPDKKTEESLIKITNKQGWEIGLTVGGGFSARVNPLSLGGAVEKSHAYSISQSFGGGLPFVVVPGELMSGQMVQGGGYARKKLSKRFAFSTGLVFTSFGTEQQTGEYISGTTYYSNNGPTVRADGYYRPGKNSVFTNKYYFLDVPLSLEWQLNKGRKTGIIWSNGLTPSVLAATNSIIYNSSASTYYKDKTAYKGLQLSYQTGIAGRFGMNSKHPVTAGVMMNMGLSNLHKLTTTEKNKLFSVGIQLKYAIKK